MSMSCGETDKGQRCGQLLVPKQEIDGLALAHAPERQPAERPILH